MLTLDMFFFGFQNVFRVKQFVPGFVNYLLFAVTKLMFATRSITNVAVILVPVVKDAVTINLCHQLS